MKILCAEDDPVSRRLIQYMVTKSGHQTIAVADGEAAWEAMQQPGAPLFAILDWMMPKMSGIEVCTKIRELERREYIYIMLLTAKGQREDITEGFKAGADDYIVKPASQIELQARINTGIRILNLQEELQVLRGSAINTALGQAGTTDSKQRA